MSQPLSKDTSQHANRWLKQQKSKSNGLLAKAIAFGSFNGLLMIGQMALLAILINQAIFEQRSLTELGPWFGYLVVVVILRALFGYLSERFSQRAAARIKQQIRHELLAKIVRLGPAYCRQFGQSNLAQLTHQGVESLQDYFAGYLPVVAYCAVIPFGVLALVFPFDWGAGLILVFTAPFIPFFMILIGQRAEAMNQQHWAKLLRMSSHFLDIIQGLTQLKVFNAARQELAAVKSISDDYRRQTMKILRVAFLSSFFLEFLASVSIALVAVIFGFRLYYGEATYVIALWILLLAPEFYLPFRNLGTQYHAKMAGAAAAVDMIKLLEQPEPTTTAKPTSVDVALARPSLVAPFTLTCQQVNFAYAGRRNTLVDINLQISGPGLFAIVGASGAGKSTLIDILLGFQSPDSGHVLVNQQPLTPTLRDRWLNHCGWIAQQGQVFFGSIAYNLALSDDIDINLAQQALAQAGLNPFVDSLEKGINTQVGEGGLGLSGGQSQRLALARAFYHQPEVLILDEPSSHLDKDSEAIVLDAIKEYAKTHLVIVIAHRLHTVKQANAIIVMAEGQVVEQGDHQQLLAQNGIYHAMLHVDSDLSGINQEGLKPTGVGRHE
ncbi:thiol reductant ABC exporter subunit CydD [Motilimonas eburnea]|uniref:thiol reductant ABC exporter subunit CydD n=1 Tax=Motilimonas eburnea TaxID=1737488 RepID=UPI001E5A0452|nr:thiol reductant ABC exporter subunit CydD [Motilimonas eburnea]MCE2573253.1 thiol reductant ABC exporter subunit CydD [Motilimonas eburnea]